MSTPSITRSATPARRHPRRLLRSGTVLAATTLLAVGATGQSWASTPILRWTTNAPTPVSTLTLPMSVDSAPDASGVYFAYYTTLESGTRPYAGFPAEARGRERQPCAPGGLQLLQRRCHDDGRPLHLRSRRRCRSELCRPIPLHTGDDVLPGAQAGRCDRGGAADDGGRRRDGDRGGGGAHRQFRAAIGLGPVQERRSGIHRALPLRGLRPADHSDVRQTGRHRGRLSPIRAAFPRSPTRRPEAV